MTLDSAQLAVVRVLRRLTTVDRQRTMRPLVGAVEVCVAIVLAVFAIALWIESRRPPSAFDDGGVMARGLAGMAAGLAGVVSVGAASAFRLRRSFWWLQLALAALIASWFWAQVHR
jgi:hypothetical protein